MNPICMSTMPWFQAMGFRVPGFGFSQDVVDTRFGVLGFPVLVSGHGLTGCLRWFVERGKGRGSLRRYFIRVRLRIVVSVFGEPKALNPSVQGPEEL